MRPRRWALALALATLVSGTACGSDGDADTRGRATPSGRAGGVDLTLTGELAGRITEVEPYQLGCNIPTPHGNGRVWTWLAAVEGKTYRFVLSAIPYRGPGKNNAMLAILAPSPERDIFLYQAFPDPKSLTVDAGERSGRLAIDLAAAADAPGAIPRRGTRKVGHIEGRWACPSKHPLSRD